MSSQIIFHIPEQRTLLLRDLLSHRSYTPWRSAHHCLSAAFCEHRFNVNHFRNLITSSYGCYENKHSVEEFDIAKKTVVSSMLAQNIMALRKFLRTQCTTPCRGRLLVAYLLKVCASVFNIGSLTRHCVCIRTLLAEECVKESTVNSFGNLDDQSLCQANFEPGDCSKSAAKYEPIYLGLKRTEPNFHATATSLRRLIINYVLAMLFQKQ